jgi:maltose phosphorylase
MHNSYFKTDPWLIIEEKFDPKKQKASESIFSIGNGHMGQRATFEEKYSGESAQGNYVAGVYYPDATKVGWWKNGYPEYFAKVVNVPNWLGIDINLGTTEELNLATCKILEFRRTLNMHDGTLERTCIVELKDGKQVKIVSQRFISMANKEIGAIKYSITPLNFSGDFTFTIYIDADIKNESSYYDEYFLDEVHKEAFANEAYIITVTKKTFFHLCTGTKFSVTQNNKTLNIKTNMILADKYAANMLQIHCPQNVETIIYKYAAVTSSLNHAPLDLIDTCKKLVAAAQSAGYNSLLKDHMIAWHTKWQMCDVIIEGDIAAQQAIRFNIFQLTQTYTGDDPRLNIGPKGFTGEKYGGVTYWDTEAFCLPFYLHTTAPAIAKNLLLYRYKHLEKAIENAKKLGFNKGAALYPMVTINGEECHNEWEITFEEIHRNGAIAYAIYSYVNYTKDENYLFDYGLEVLIALSRFWSQRVNFSTAKNKYVILGVTGPNEYENNVNNNWYTNTMANWTLRYTLKTIAKIKQQDNKKYQNLSAKISFNEQQETALWQKIVDNMYFGEDETRKIFLQQEGYLDKEQILAKDLDPTERPLNQHWSWDRILRSCFIKQADVLQGLYLFQECFDFDTIKRNFDFYEPRTVHESSLSACIHAVLAARLGYLDKAYELYLRTTRLDLDDYNKEVAEGCHITSMGGAWLAIVHGFAGMTIKDDKLHFDPVLPPNWQGYSFKIRFRNEIIQVTVNKNGLNLNTSTI